MSAVCPLCGDLVFSQYHPNTISRGLYQIIVSNVVIYECRCESGYVLFDYRGKIYYYRRRGCPTGYGIIAGVNEI